MSSPAAMSIKSALVKVNVLLSIEFLRMCNDSALAIMDNQLGYSVAKTRIQLKPIPPRLYFKGFGKTEGVPFFHCR